MDQNYISILIESLEKKLVILDELKSLSEEQSKCISDEMELDVLDPFIKRKSELIEELEKLDDGFETLYEKIADELKAGKEQYADSIRRMQELIKKITERSTAIQVQEERNRAGMNSYFGKRRTEVKEGRIGTRAAMNYYKVQSGSGYVDSQFMDSKK